MFEVGMSALVLKICSEYAKSLGLNFPPCTQQEINAICEWVDKHAVKDMTITQNGYIVTFTFKGEYDTTKEFTITIPKNVNVDELEKVLIGSDSVVVERLEDNSGLRVRLAQSVIIDINSRLIKPANPASESAVTMLADGTVGTKPLSEIGGSGGKLYMHRVTFVLENYAMYFLIIDIPTNTNNDITVDFLRNYIQGYCAICYNGPKGIGVVSLSNTSNNIVISGSVGNVENKTVENVYMHYDNTNGLAIKSQILIEL